MIYAYTDSGSPQKHKDHFGSFLVDLSKGEEDQILTAQNSKFGDGSFMFHQHGMPILWTLICDRLIVVGKHLKKKNRYFDIHAWSFFVLGIVSVILVNFAPDDHHHDHKNKVQKSSMIGLRTLTESEIMVISSWAKGSVHKFTGKASNIITLLMIL